MKIKLLIITKKLKWRYLSWNTWKFYSTFDSIIDGATFILHENSIGQKKQSILLRMGAEKLYSACREDKSSDYWRPGPH